MIVRAAVRALPARQRQAVVARHYLGLSVKQTASIMGRAPGTVTALTHQAVTRLRRSTLLDEDASNDLEHGLS
ncbi:MAG TPA: sigma factor-like helix-turn-helix DNA-binding protein [Acidimicrobiales bacterium]|nr:sigma factor-like helix-turn-helix DNA-binding protein [Acidimicrobiales bacterium]